MIKVNAEKLAEEVIPMLQKMFGEGIDFSCTEYYQSNETLTGITFCCRYVCLCRCLLPCRSYANSLSVVRCCGASGTGFVLGRSV